MIVCLSWPFYCCVNVMLRHCLFIYESRSLIWHLWAPMKISHISPVNVCSNHPHLHAPWKCQSKSKTVEAIWELHGGLLSELLLGFVICLVITYLFAAFALEYVDMMLWTLFSASLQNLPSASVLFFSLPLNWLGFMWIVNWWRFNI